MFAIKKSRPLAHRSDQAEYHHADAGRTAIPPGFGAPWFRARSGPASPFSYAPATHRTTPLPCPVQAKLAVGEAGDALELEADRAADHVMRMSDPSAAAPAPIRSIRHSRVDRACAACEAEDELQRQAAGAAGGMIAPPVVHDVLGSPGKSLDAATRAFMEPRFGYDFCGVRIHDDPQAAASARAISALAYTHGSDIVFDTGRYEPGTSAGRRLLAHELTHVVQQAGAASLPGGLAVQRAPVGVLLRKEQLFEARLRQVVAGSLGGADKAAAAVLEVKGWSSDPANTVATDANLVNAIDGAYRKLQAVLTNEAHFASMPAGKMRLVVTTALDAAADAKVQSIANDRGWTVVVYRAASATSIVEEKTFAPAAAGSAAAAPASPAIPPPPATPQVPNADVARDLGFELDPGTRPAPPPPPPVIGPPPPPPPVAHWDGAVAGGAPPAPGSVEATARATMQTELFAAFDTFINGERSRTLALLARPRVSFDTPAAPAGGSAPPSAPTGVVDIANRARTELERRYGTTMDAGTRSPAQSVDRGLLKASGLGKNLFDPYSEADRRALTAGQIDLPDGVAYWLFDNVAPKVLATHHYSAGDDPNRAYHLGIAHAYAAASTLNGVTSPATNAKQLIDYRLAEWNERGSGVTLLSAFDPGNDAAKGELVQRWELFKTATHEALHLRAHPAFTDAQRGREVMHEGFTEMFAISTLNTDVLPRVRAGSAEDVRRSVEGALFTPTPDTSIITDKSSGVYTAHREAAERIRDGGTPTGGTVHQGIGEAGVRAVFFQGHVEYLGLKPTGDPIQSLPAAGVKPPIRVPTGMTGLDDLAARSGVARATIVADNPGITDALPATAVLTGCTEHWVVVANGVPETRANIAAQHGVSEAALTRANPDVPLVGADWAPLTAGQEILIPVP